MNFIERARLNRPSTFAPYQWILAAVPSAFRVGNKQRYRYSVLLSQSGLNVAVCEVNADTLASYESFRAWVLAEYGAVVRLRPYCGGDGDPSRFVSDIEKLSTSWPVLEELFPSPTRFQEIVGDGVPSWTAMDLPGKTGALVQKSDSCHQCGSNLIQQNEESI